MNIATAARSLRLATAAMGTRFELLILEPVGSARAVGELALEEIETWHRRLTRFAPDSLLTHINRTAASAPVRLDRATWALFADALAVHRQSAGAFDIVAGASAGSAAIELDAGACTIRFRTPGIALDLGGIAKGHAIDCAAAVLREHGVTAALLHGGTSSVAAIGAPPAARGWKVALARAPDAPVVTLRDTTLSVSWTGGGRTGEPHILDPRTGAPADGMIAAVIGPSARLGDAWATASAVLGRRPAALPADWTTCIVRPDGVPAWAGPDAPRSS